MVKFHLSMGGYSVEVDGKQIGSIDREGFFTDPVIGPKDFIRVSANDLRIIANRAEEFMRRRY